MEVDDAAAAPPIGRDAAMSAQMPAAGLAVPTSERAPTPLVWAIIGDKLGDNAQVQAVARALPWPVVEKKLAFRPLFRKGKPIVLPSLYHVTRASAATLSPPWPDLVLTIGRRPSMAALWVRRMSAGRTRIALFGPPKGMATTCDLFVVAAHYGVAEHARVVRLGLPLLAADPEAVRQAGMAWAERFATLPRPLTAVLVGGATRPFRFDAAVAQRLVAAAVAVTPAAGSLFVSTSRRTPTLVTKALQRALPDRAVLHCFDAGGDANPYLGLLALADRFIVTGDSVSMLIEVARTGAPLAIYELPRRRFALSGVRDLDAVHTQLYATRRAVPLGTAFLPRRDPEPLDAAEVGGICARLYELMAAAPDGMLPARPARVGTH